MSGAEYTNPAYDFPTAVTLDGEPFAIRNACDYRMVLDCIAALTDSELSERQKVQCALVIFYEDYDRISDVQGAIDAMFRIIRAGDTEPAAPEKPPLMDWQKDFSQLAPPVSRVLGYEVRTPGRYTHWWTFVGAYMEIGECTFATIVSIRAKKQSGKRLEPWEEAFYREHYETVALPVKLSAEEQAFFDVFGQ